MSGLNPCQKCGSEPSVNVLDDSVTVCCGRCDSDDEYFIIGKSAVGAVNAWNAVTSEQPAKTLRDEFAMAVISGYMATDSSISNDSAVWFAEYAYLVADAMLKERSK